MARTQQVPKEYKDARDRLAEAGKFNVAEGRGFAAGRVRTGKTRRDREGGAHARAEGRKRFPIRCTSSHRVGGQDNRGPEFWMG